MCFPQLLFKILSSRSASLFISSSLSLRLGGGPCQPDTRSWMLVVDSWRYRNVILPVLGRWTRCACALHAVQVVVRTRHLSCVGIVTVGQRRYGTYCDGSFAPVRHWELWELRPGSDQLVACEMAGHLQPYVCLDPGW